MAIRATASTIGYKLEGSPEDEGRVRLHELLNSLQKFYSCLKRLEIRPDSGRKANIYYRVVELNTGSAEILIEPVSSQPSFDPRIILERMDTGLNAILEGKPLPSWMDYEVLDSFKELASPLKRHVRRIEIVRPRKRYFVTAEFEKRIEKIWGAEIIADGSATGFLDSVNVHGVNHFHIYPMVGHTKILCAFATEHLSHVKDGLKRYVTVYGKLHYKEHDNFPHRVDLESLEIPPADEDLPLLSSLRGIAPHATGDIDSVAFVRRLRDIDEE